MEESIAEAVAEAIFRRNTAMKPWVFLFPGHGSQYVGMGREFYENYSEVAAVHGQATFWVDVAHCFDGGGAGQTETQPLP
jgi:[acyl-carrier-protein] S-malonyltransferase